MPLNVFIFQSLNLKCYFDICTLYLNVSVLFAWMLVLTAEYETVNMPSSLAN